jgi:hypothetical protein
VRQFNVRRCSRFASGCRLGFLCFFHMTQRHRWQTAYARIAGACQGLVRTGLRLTRCGGFHRSGGFNVSGGSNGSRLFDRCSGLQSGLFSDRRGNGSLYGLRSGDRLYTAILGN